MFTCPFESLLCESKFATVHIDYNSFEMCKLSTLGVPFILLAMVHMLKVNSLERNGCGAGSFVLAYVAFKDSRLVRTAAKYPLHHRWKILREQFLEPSD